MNECCHQLGDGSTLVTAADECSLECEICHEIVLCLVATAMFFEMVDG